MALTATATCDTFNVIVKQLSLKDPVLVAVSPNRANIKLSVNPSQPLEEFASEISEELKIQKKNYPKTIIFIMIAQEYMKEFSTTWVKIKQSFKVTQTY